MRSWHTFVSPVGGRGSHVASSTTCQGARRRGGSPRGSYRRGAEILEACGCGRDGVESALEGVDLKPQSGVQRLVQHASFTDQSDQLLVDLGFVLLKSSSLACNAGETLSEDVPSPLTKQAVINTLPYTSKSDSAIKFCGEKIEYVLNTEMSTAGQ